MINGRADAKSQHRRYAPGYIYGSNRYEAYILYRAEKISDSENFFEKGVDKRIRAKYNTTNIPTW